MAAAIEQRQRRVPVSVARLRRAVDRALAAIGRPAGLVDVAVVEDGEMRELNARWRGIRRRTDVLAFPLEHVGATSPLVGQIIISADAALRQARRVRVPVALELDLLATHATLHLVGWDDRDPVEADLMHRREREILRDAPARLWSGLLNRDGRAGGWEPPASRTGHPRVGRAGRGRCAGRAGGSEPRASRTGLSPVNRAGRSHDDLEQATHASSRARGPRYNK